MPEEVVRNTSFSGGIAMKYQFNQSIISIFTSMNRKPILNITFIYKSALSNIYYCVNIVARSNPDRIGLFVCKLSPHKIMSPSQIPTLLDCPNPNPNHSHALPRPRSQMHCNLIGLVNWPDSRTLGHSDENSSDVSFSESRL